LTFEENCVLTPGISKKAIFYKLTSSGLFPPPKPMEKLISLKKKKAEQFGLLTEQVGKIKAYIEKEALRHTLQKIDGP